MLVECLVGNAVEVTVTFTDTNNQPQDPTTTTIKVRHADTLAVDSYTGVQLTHVGPGIYKVSFTPDKPGRWYVKGVGTGSVTATDEDYVLANESIIP